MAGHKHPLEPTQVRSLLKATPIIFPAEGSARTTEDQYQSVSGTQIEAILTRFAQADVDFVIIGGVAGLAHGSARVTFDVDVCYKRTPENIRRLCDTLAPLHPRLRGAPEGLPSRPLRKPSLCMVSK